MEKVKSRFKKIDALFVNAGVGKFVPFDQVTEAFYDEIMNVKRQGRLLSTVQKALPLLATRSRRRPERVDQPPRKGMPGTTVYGASKAAVVNMAKNHVGRSGLEGHPSQTPSVPVRSPAPSFPAWACRTRS